jgi:hypothetical protein
LWTALYKDSPLHEISKALVEYSGEEYETISPKLKNILHFQQGIVIEDDEKQQQEDIYKKNGKPVLIITFNSDGSIFKIETYQYNKEGKRKKMVVEIYNKTGNIIKKEITVLDEEGEFESKEILKPLEGEFIVTAVEILDNTFKDLQTYPHLEFIIIHSYAGLVRNMIKVPEDYHEYHYTYEAKDEHITEEELTQGWKRGALK